MRQSRNSTQVFEQRGGRCARGVLLALAMALAGTALAAGPASAAFVEFANGRVTYFAGLNETNDVRIDGGPSSIRVQDAGATIDPGNACAAQADGSVVCGSAGADIQQLAVYVRDGSDTVEAETILPLVQLFGGGGNDDMLSNSGSGGEHRLFGGTGVDVLATATNNGGLSIIDGGPDGDAISLLEGGAFQFSGSRGDDVLLIGGGIGLPSFLNGGSGADTYVFSGGGDVPRELPTGLIVPGPGIDTLALDDATGLVDLAPCGGCVEDVVGSSFGDALLGDDAANGMTGGDGPDVIDPRGGTDTVAGDGGDDVLLTRDGEADTVTCGDGSDRVVADPIDTVDADSCEDVRTDEDGVAGGAPDSGPQEPAGAGTEAPGVLHPPGPADVERGAWRPAHPSDDPAPEEREDTDDPW